MTNAARQNLTCSLIVSIASVVIAVSIGFVWGFSVGRSEGATEAFRISNTNSSMLALSNLKLAKEGNATASIQRMESIIDDHIIALNLFRHGSIWSRKQDIDYVNRALDALVEYRKSHPFLNPGPLEVQQKLRAIVQGKE